MPSGMLTRPSSFFATLWLATPLFPCLALYLHALAGGHMTTLPRYLSFILEFVLWAPLVPLLVWLARRITGGPVAALASHLAIFLLVSTAVHALCILFYGSTLLGLTGALALLGNKMFLGRELCVSAFIYSATVCGVRLVDLLAAARERELRTTRAERELASAEVQLVSGQLRPEYLARIFQWVIAHLRSEPEAAEGMIHRLADFLRLNVHAISGCALTLRDDVELVTAWARVESLRTGNAIEVENAIDHRWLELPIAAPLLQPLVESATAQPAFWHIRLAADHTAGALELSVSVGERLHRVLLPAVDV